MYKGIVSPGPQFLWKFQDPRFLSYSLCNVILHPVTAQSVKDVCLNILKNINTPLCLWDERLSTVGAFNLSSQLDIKVSKKIKNIDKNAAAFILQGALDYLKN